MLEYPLGYGKIRGTFVLYRQCKRYNKTILLVSFGVDWCLSKFVYAGYTWLDPTV